MLFKITSIFLIFFKKYKFRMDKIAIKNLVKIFGDRPGKALDMLRRGSTKKDILAETGQAVGVADVSFLRAGRRDHGHHGPVRQRQVHPRACAATA